MIGDRVRQLDETEAPARVARRDRGAGQVARRRDVARGDAGVRHRHAPDLDERPEKAAALGQHDGMRIDLAQSLDRRPGDAQQTVIHPPSDLGEQVQLVLREDVVAFPDRPGDRVVDRQQPEVGAPGEQGLGHAAERRAAQRRERDAAPRGICAQDGV